MIISGGENIFPSEVENVVGGHPKVKNVRVIGVPHENWGEQVTAVVVLHEGQTATLEEISDHCREKIAGYKIPKKVIFIEEEGMPRPSPARSSTESRKRDKACGRVINRFQRQYSVAVPY